MSSGGKREGAGRKGKGYATIHKAFRLRIEDAEFIQSTSEEVGITQAEVIHELINSYLDNINKRRA